MNRNFAKLKADNTPEYAPDALVLDGRTILAPKAVHYAKAGYLPLVDKLPDVPAPEGYHWERRGWSIHDGDVKRIIRDVEAVPNPPPAPRTFSKLKCVAALMEAGVWSQVKNYIEGAGLYDLYLAAQDFREDNPYFVSGKAQLMASLGWTDEQTEAILSEAVATEG